MTGDDPRTRATASKDALRRLIPDFLLQERGIVLRLGAKAGPIYARLRLLDALGVRTANQRRAPASARSFLFVCFGNIMRSAMAETLMRRVSEEIGLGPEPRIMSAGLHAIEGHEPHPWAQQVSAELGISLAEHRAKLLTREMVETADCILAMDFQNKAELLAIYPESKNKICMISAYGEGEWRYREIEDPYLGSLESTRICAGRLQICIQNLMASLFPSPHSAAKQDISGS